MAFKLGMTVDLCMAYIIKLMTLTWMQGRSGLIGRGTTSALNHFFLNLLMFGTLVFVKLSLSAKQANNQWNSLRKEVRTFLLFSDQHCSCSPETEPVAALAALQEARN